MPVRLTRILGAVAVMAVMAVASANAGGRAGADHVARFLAGMTLPKSSPLGDLAATRSWRVHARQFDNAWQALDARQLAKIRDWRKIHLGQPRPAMFYMFSGPDFLYADAFFPAAKTYVLSGLEPIGRRPDVSAVPRYALSGALGHLRASLSTVLNYSFFITKDMKEKLKSGRFTGTLPILYVFLARAGKTIHKVRFVALEKDGTVWPIVKTKRRRGGVPGVKITFSGRAGNEQTLYYFQTDLSDGGVRRSGFLKFVANLGIGDSLLKSASYLLHQRHFNKMREFLLARSATIVQDDSGIPVRHFKAKTWQLHPFGRYFRPIPIFAPHYQPEMKRLFRTGRAAKATFGIGYRWRVHDTNVLLARRRTAQATNDR